MSKSTYNAFWLLNPHMYVKDDYPHKDSITFIVVTTHAPKSTYSPPLTESLVAWSDEYLQHVVDEMMGLDGMDGWNRSEE
jgi:hypothetical protein